MSQENVRTMAWRSLKGRDETDVRWDDLGGWGGRGGGWNVLENLPLDRSLPPGSHPVQEG